MTRKKKELLIDIGRVDREVFELTVEMRCAFEEAAFYLRLTSVSEGGKQQ